MIIVGKLILVKARNQTRKTKIRRKKKKDRCSVFTSRDFALVVMVMPCGLTPVEGIDFVDWFYFSMYACAHVRPTQKHTHTHRPMYSTVPLKSGRCLLNLNISQ